MKKAIFLVLFAWMVSMPQMGVSATMENALTECKTCRNYPAQRYAKAHKDKKFTGWDSIKPKKANKRNRDSMGRKISRKS